MIQSQIGVGQSLGLHALGGVHHQHRALAGGQGAGHLVVEVHMARSVNEVQGVNLAVLGLVKQMDGPGLDGDAPLAFQVHVVQQLVFHFPLRHGVAFLQQAVRQRGFAVVNVSDDGEITDVGLVEHKVKASLGKSTLRRTPCVQAFCAAKPCRRRNSFLPRGINMKKLCHSEERSDVGIRSPVGADAPVRPTRDLEAWVNPAINLRRGDPCGRPLQPPSYAWGAMPTSRRAVDANAIPAAPGQPGPA